MYVHVRTAFELSLNQVLSTQHCYIVYWVSPLTYH